METVEHKQMSITKEQKHYRKKLLDDQGNRSEITEDTASEPEVIP